MQNGCPSWFVFLLLSWCHAPGLCQFGHLFLQNSDGILMLLLHILHLTFESTQFRTQLRNLGLFDLGRFHADRFVVQHFVISRDEPYLRPLLQTQGSSAELNQIAESSGWIIGLDSDHIDIGCLQFESRFVQRLPSDVTMPNTLRGWFPAPRSR